MPALNYDYDYDEYRNGHRIVTAAPSVKSNVRTTTNRSKVTTRNVVASSRKSTKTVPSTSRTQSKKKINTSTAQKNKVATKRKNERNTLIQTSSRIKEKPQEMTLKRPKVKQKGNFVAALKNVAFISVFFAMFFMICYRYSVMNEEFSGIKKLQTELAEIQAVNEQLQADIESKTDLTYVENYAKYQLGMQKPSSSQLQYVSVEKQDKITKPVTIDEEEEGNWFENIVKEIRKIID